jgi:phosphoglycolate phosphatase
MRANTMPTLVLWDVDLTLVDYTGIGRQWYQTVLANVLGIDLVHIPAFPGRTERAITLELLAAHGVDHDEDMVAKMFAELVAVSTAARTEMRDFGRALPGAADVLDALAARDDVVQSLVTGNLPEVAGIKLEPFGFDLHIDLEIGGYGSLSEHRHDLVAAALRLAAAKHGVRFPSNSVVVIGDTPHDVTAALHHGTIAIGVATGRHDAADLAAAGAHVVLDDLSDTDAVLAAILS